MGETYTILVQKPLGNTPLGRPECRWEDDITMDFKSMGSVGVDWIKMAQNRVQ
jgi:hypothetical protein